MPELDDELFSSFKDQGAPVNPLPAAEVRRRGDRMRRRNNTLSAVGGVAAALVVIATPLAVLGGGSDSAAPDPIAPPARVWMQQIPAGFPLTAGLSDGAERSGEPGVPLLALCDQSAFDADQQTVDVAGTISRGAPNTDEPELRRTLALYPDAATAAQAVDRLRDAVGACRSEAGAGNDTILHELIASDLEADESFLYTDSYVADGEDYPQAISYYVVVRTGNAVLVTSDPSTIPYDKTVTIEQERVADVVAAMQVFSETTTTATSTDEEATLGETVPDDFDLLAGFPEQSAATGSTVGREGPARDLDLAPYGTLVEACGATPTGLPTPTDTVYAGWRDPSQGLLRQLMTFGSEADAQAYANGTLAVYDDCPEVTDDLGVAKIYQRSDAPRVGDQASTVVMRMEVDGEPGPGHHVVQVVRVGSAVLLFVATADAADPVQPGTGVEDLVATYLGTNQPVIDAM